MLVGVSILAVDLVALMPAYARLVRVFGVVWCFLRVFGRFWLAVWFGAVVWLLWWF